MLVLRGPGQVRVGSLGRGRRQAAGRGERAFWWGLQELGKGQRAGQALAGLLCLAFSAREQRQRCQVPQLRRSTAASPGIRAEEAGGEAVLKPPPGKRPCLVAEQLVRRGPGGAGGQQGEHEPARCLGGKAGSGVLGCVRRSVAGRGREGILALHWALARQALRCCVQGWAAQHRRDVGLLARARQRAARRC